jgi:hypothetical protein
MSHLVRNPGGVPTKYDAAEDKTSDQSLLADDMRGLLVDRGREDAAGNARCGGVVTRAQVARLVGGSRGPEPAAQRLVVLPDKPEQQAAPRLKVRYQHREGRW